MNVNATKNLKLSILSEIESANLIVWHSYPDQFPTLRITKIHDVKFDVRLTKPHGNAYMPAPNECFIDVHLDADRVDWDIEGWTEEEVSDQANYNHICDNIDNWVELALDQFGVNGNEND